MCPLLPAKKNRGKYAIYHIGDDGKHYSGSAIFSMEAAQHMAYSIGVISRSSDFLLPSKEYWVDTIPPTKRIEPKFRDEEKTNDPNHLHLPGLPVPPP